MKWIRQVLWKIQSGHDFVHRQMDRQTDGLMDGQRETPFQLQKLKSMFSRWKCSISVKFPWILLEAPLNFNGASRNIQGNLTGMCSA